MAYPKWWDSTITIYNRYEDEQTHVITWFKTIIQNSFWDYVHDKVVVGDVTLDSSKVVCRIRENDNFLKKYEWEQLPNDEMSNYFTLGIGDIIINGEVDDEINEYTSGSRSTDILSKYKSLQGCMEVSNVSINVGSGRGLPHYLAEGI